MGRGVYICRVCRVGVLCVVPMELKKAQGSKDILWIESFGRKVNDVIRIYRVTEMFTVMDVLHVAFSYINGKNRRIVLLIPLQCASRTRYVVKINMSSFLLHHRDFFILFSFHHYCIIIICNLVL